MQIYTCTLFSNEVNLSLVRLNNNLLSSSNNTYKIVILHGIFLSVKDCCSMPSDYKEMT